MGIFDNIVNYENPDQISGIEERTIAKNLKDSNTNFGDTFGAIVRESIPFARSSQLGTNPFSGVNRLFSSGRDFDINREEFKGLIKDMSLEDTAKMYQATSIEDSVAMKKEIEASNADLETIEETTNMGGALALYATAGFLDPTSYLGYGLVARAGKMSVIASRMLNATRTERAVVAGATAMTIEGLGAAQVESTGAQAYENVGFTMLTAAAIGGGGYAIFDVIKKNNEINKKKALKDMAEANINPKVDPEEAQRLMDVFEQDSLAPIRSKLLKAYDKTVGHVFNSKLTSSPMIRAWRKGGTISAIASKFDTNVGMSFDTRAGTKVYNNADTAFDVKYRLASEFGKTEIARGKAYSKYIQNFKKTENNPKPLTQPQFAEEVYGATVKNQNKYNELKFNKEEEIRADKEKMSELSDNVVKKIDQDDEIISMSTEEQNAIRKEMLNSEIEQEAAKRIKENKEFKLEASEEIKMVIDSNNEYYKAFDKELKKTGIDKYKYFDAEMYVPRMYNTEAIINGKIDEVINDFAKSIESSIQYKKEVYRIEREIKELLENSSEETNKLAEELARLHNKEDSLKDEVKNLLKEYSNWNFNGLRYGENAWANHERIEELLYMRQDVLAKDMKYSKKLVQARQINPSTDPVGEGVDVVGAIYEPNYSIDFSLTKSDVKKIREGKITPALRDKIENDLGALDNNPLYAKLEDDIPYNKTINKEDYLDVENFYKSNRKVGKREGAAIDDYKIAVAYGTRKEQADALKKIFDIRAKLIESTKKRYAKKVREVVNKQRMVGADTRDIKKIKKLDEKKKKLDDELEKYKNIYKPTLAQLKNKKELTSEIFEIETELKMTSTKLPEKIRSKLNEARELIMYPKKSAEAMIENIINKKDLGEIDFSGVSPSRFRGRVMMINPADGKMAKYMRTNEAEIAQMYQYHTSGNIAVKHATGHLNSKDFVEDLKAKEKEQEIIDEYNYKKELEGFNTNKTKVDKLKIRLKQKKTMVEREAVLKEIKKIGKIVKPKRIERKKLDVDDFVISKDLFDLTKGTRQIAKNPDNNWEKAVRRISQYNYITMGGQFAKYGISEIGAGVYSTGFRYFAEAVPALKDVIKMYRGKELDAAGNDILRMIEGYDIHTANTRAAVSDTEWYETMFSKSDTAGDKLDTGLKKTSEFMFRYSGLEAITVLTKTALPRAFLGRIIEQANKGKFYQPDLLRWGITPDDMISIAKEKHISNKDGKLVDFNFNGWKDKDLARRFQRATTRMGRDTIMRNDAVRLPVWMTNRSGIDGRDGTHPIFVLAKQFMSFTMLSHERLLLRGLNEKSAMAGAGALSSAMLLMTFATLQEELAVGIGAMKEKDRKYDITTADGLKNLSIYTATRHSFAGVPGVAAENIVGLINPAYRSGEQALTKVIGGPTLSKIFSARNVATEAIDGNFGTQNQAYFTKSLFPLNNVIGLQSIIDMGIMNPIKENIANNKTKKKAGIYE